MRHATFKCERNKTVKLLPQNLRKVYSFTASVRDSDNSDVISPFLPVVCGERDCLSEWR